MSEITLNDLTDGDYRVLKAVPDEWENRLALDDVTFVYANSLAHLSQMGLVEYVGIGPDDDDAIYRRTPKGRALIEAQQPATHVDGDDYTLAHQQHEQNAAILGALDNAAKMRTALEQIAALNVDTLGPIEAITKLYELKRMAWDALKGDGE